MNDNITTQICEKNMSGDFSTELSMPDYEPEIRRLLRVGVTLTPPVGFADTGRVGMNGEIIYDILYMGNDGSLYSTRARDRYELAEALKQNEKAGDITGIICEVTPESLVSRASAPRKISMRCKLRGRIRGFGEQEIAMRHTYIENPDSIEKLTDECEYIWIFPSSLAEVRLSDDFSAELPSGTSGDIRIISHTATALCEDIEPSNDEATVKGTLYLSMLATVDDEESLPFKLYRKIPFAETIEVNDLTPTCKCIASVSCSECNFTIEDNRIFCEPTIVIKLDAEETRRAEYTKDIYSTEVLSETTVKRYEFPSAGKVFSGNFTTAISEQVSALAIPDGAEISDATATAAVKNIETNGNKSLISGELCVNILTKSDGEYIAKELKSPFKYEFDSGEQNPLFIECAVTPFFPRVKIDGERLLCDCELQVISRVFSKSQFTSVNEVIFGEKIAYDGATTVCFPSPTDTLWDIAKRYHIPTESIISQESRIDRGEAIIF